MQDRPWDPEKARSNFAEHGVAFEEARFVVIAIDRQGRMRIISARRATKRERHAYEAR